MLGDGGADAFRFDDGHAGLGAASGDRISGFLRSQGDKLDVELIDANLNVTDDQDFAFRGSAAFTGIGQIRVVGSGKDRIIRATTTATWRPTSKSTSWPSTGPCSPATSATSDWIHGEPK